MRLLDILKSLTTLPIEQVPISSLGLLRPSVFARSWHPQKEFIRSCQVGILNPVTATRDNELIDGNSRLVASRIWKLKTIPVRRLMYRLGREEVIRLAIFLNPGKRRLAVNVGDRSLYVNPVVYPPDDLESRLDQAREIMEIQLEDDIAFTKIVSQRRVEFTANFDDCVDTALKTARTITAFTALWDKEPPLPLASAKHHSQETLWALSLLQNSRSQEILKSQGFHPSISGNP